MKSTRQVSFCGVLLILFCGLLFSTVDAASKSRKGLSKTNNEREQNKLWRETDKNRYETSQSLPQKYLTYRLNQTLLSSIIGEMPLEFTAAAREKTVVLELPAPDGKIMRFRIEESPVLSSELAQKYPTWKTFSGQGIDDPTAVARFDWSSTGFHGFVIGIDGTYFVSPYQDNNRQDYIVYYKKDSGDSSANFHCKLDETLANRNNKENHFDFGFNSFSYGQDLRTLRIAIAATGEWTQSFPSQTAALNDIMTGVNRQNLIYRRDFSVQFQLVSGTNVVYTDPNTDPYDNTDNTAQLAANQTNLDNVIGAANYDIGHLVGTGGGGVATSPVVCENGFKGRGYSARGTMRGDPFWVDYVAHEIGHQFGAGHTYNTSEGTVCSTRSAANAFEVASGATIMSYVGICGARNLQRYSLDNFHIRSMTQMIANLGDPNGGGQCPVTGATGNNLPTVNPGANYTIPKLTPFTLTAVGTDADGGDVLTYSWEQYDLAPSASGPNGTPAGTYDVDTDGVLRPLFRNYAPTTNPSRTFPSLPYILNNANQPPLTYMGTSPMGAVCADGEECVTGENLPSVARTMNFRVVVRDNRAAGGGVVDAGMTVTVVNTPGAFKVTTQNAAPAAWQGGTQQTVTWDVNNTNQAPISAANVKISLSTDGGQTFPTTIVASTPNDGTESITVPNNATTQARIKVEAVGNIFFDINDVNFTITAGNPTQKAFVDFDGDRKTDISIFRPSNGQWWYQQSADNVVRAFTFGSSTDKIVPGDYDGDNKTDVAFWRPATGEWYVLRSSNLTFFAAPFGASTDVPAPGDYDGDGKTDFAVFRPANGVWFILKSTGGVQTTPFGSATDIPQPADYDGDGKSDIAIFRPTGGTGGGEWWMLRSSNASVFAMQFGAATDKPVPGDYTGDGKADFAFFRPASSEWYVLRSENLSFFAAPFGANGDIPIAGDYDGDNKFDLAVFRPASATWFVLKSSGGTLIQAFGATGDKPVPSAFVP